MWKHWPPNCGTPAVCVFAACCIALEVPYSGVSQTPREQVPRSEVRHIDDAEVRSLAPGSIVNPQRQSDVYWHDSKWTLDLVIPKSADDPYKVGIRSPLGNTSAVELPAYYEQVREILRGPEDKAIVVEDNDRAEGDFAIIALTPGKLVDSLSVDAAEVSPNRRFVFFQIETEPAGSPGNEYQYRLYDLLKSPQENTCGYRRNDPEHKDLDGSMRGLQVYPQQSGQITCDRANGDDDNSGTHFIWSADSSKIVFADVKNGVMSLVLVTMPVGQSDIPKTSVYSLSGAQDVCAGATAANGEKICDFHVIQSLGWDSDSVKAVFRHQFGTPLNLKLTIPISLFVAIER